MALQAGAAVVDITPRTPCHLAGYAGRDHAHEGVHDPLSLRAVYVSGSRDAVLVSADIIWFREEMMDGVVTKMEKELGIPPERVLLAGTHTHSAPVPSGPNVNREWLHVLEDQVVAAAALAKSRLEPVGLKLARGASQIGVNRREEKPGGEIVLGFNPDGPIDREMILLSLDGKSGPVARVANFACHGVVLGQRNYQISGDWCGVAAARIEKEQRGKPFLFLNGGAANVNPRLRSGPQTSFEPVEALAGEFVKDVAAARKKLKAIPDDGTVEGAFRFIQMPRKQRDVDEGMGKTRKVRIQGLRLGPVSIVAFPGEVFSETAMAVKEATTPAATMVCSYASGGAAGYVPVSGAYDKGGYEVRVSPYREGAEVVLLDGLLALAEKLQGSTDAEGERARGGKGRSGGRGTTRRKA